MLPFAVNGGFVTFMVQVAVNPPSLVVAVITALPSPTAVTLPSLLTFATFGLLLVQLTEVTSAVAGFTVAVNFSLFPLSKLSVDLFNEIPENLLFLHLHQH